MLSFRRFLYLFSGYSPQTILSETADQIILRTNNQSKLIVCLILIWVPLLLFLLAVPTGYIFPLLVFAIIGGSTYSKWFIFDGATGTLIMRIQIYGIKREKKFKFEEIVRVHATSKFWRKGTDVVVELTNRRKLLLDKTTDIEYIESVIGSINRLFRA